MVLKTLGNSQQRRVVPERQDTNEVSPVTAPTSCLERVYRSWCWEGEPKWSPLTSELRRQSWESRESKAARAHEPEHQKGQPLADRKVRR